VTDISHLRGHIDLLRSVRAQMAQLKEIEDQTKAAIQEALGDSDEGTIDGAVAVTYRYVKSSRLDQKLLAKLHPDVLAE